MDQQRPLPTNLSYCKVVFLGSTYPISLTLDCFSYSYLRFSCGTIALMVLGQFSDICGPQGYGFHPIKNLRNCDQDFVAPFNSNFHNKMLCESGVIWIFRFVTYLSIVFHIYLCIIIHFQPSIITNVSILTDPAYFVPPSCHCGILALRSRDF